MENKMSDNLYILQEYNNDTETILTEENGKKECYIEGVFMQADVVNGNKRKYPLSVLTESVNKYLETMVKQNLGKIYQANLGNQKQSMLSNPNSRSGQGRLEPHNAPQLC